MRGLTDVAIKINNKAFVQTALCKCVLKLYYRGASTVHTSMHKPSAARKQYDESVY